ncbi:unnamed protein product, partial [Urochloa humidicola]
STLALNPAHESRILSFSAPRISPHEASEQARRHPFLLSLRRYDSAEREPSNPSQPARRVSQPWRDPSHSSPSSSSTSRSPPPLPTRPSSSRTRRCPCPAPSPASSASPSPSISTTRDPHPSQPPSLTSRRSTEQALPVALHALNSRLRNIPRRHRILCRTRGRRRLLQLPRRRQLLSADDCGGW